MLPVLEGLLRRCIEGKKVIEQVDAELSELSERIFYSGGALVDIKRTALRRAERDKAVQRVRDAMGVVVQGIDAPLVPGAVVRGMTNAVDCRVAHVHVGTRHVDLQSQHVRPIRKLPGAHAAKQVEIFRHRAIAITARRARLRQRAA